MASHHVSADNHLCLPLGKSRRLGVDSLALRMEFRGDGFRYPGTLFCRGSNQVMVSFPGLRAFALPLYEVGGALRV